MKSTTLTAATASMRSQLGFIDIPELNEQRLRKECEESGELLIKEFSTKEQLNIAFVPLIFNHIAWFYGMKARKLCASYRISIMKHLCRAFDKVRKDYIEELQKDLDLAHIRHIETETERFVAFYNMHFVQFYYTINNAFKQKMPDYPFDDLRTYAIMGMMLIKQVDIHNKRMDELIRQRTGKAQNSIRMSIMDNLYNILDAFAGEVGKFDYTDFNVQNAMKVIENKIAEMDFEII